MDYVSLAQIDNNQHLQWEPKGPNIEVHYHIEKIENFYSGTSVHGAGIGNITNNIDVIRQNDPQIANALEQLSKVNEIQQQIKELAELIAKDYNKPETRYKNRIRIGNILNTIFNIMNTTKLSVEVIRMIIPYYNILAQKYNLPTIPIP